VAVHSMKTFFVSGLMRLCQPLMIGGSESTLAGGKTNPQIPRSR
jgi:hypothetical protein